MAIDTYTHDFIYQLGDGGKFMTGEMVGNSFAPAADVAAIFPNGMMTTNRFWGT